MKAWEVPGVAVVIVRGDDVLYLKGHGVRAIDGKDPVTPDTLFPLASCSKALTTTAMAMLVDDGKMTWDDPVRKHLTMLQQQARRAAEIVQNLMYFSRPPAPGKSAINLSELIQRTLHLHAYSLRKNNITVDFLPEKSLPVVNGDPHQLMQVFLNLILNAEQAMREVRDRGTLRIRLAMDDRTVSATFQDDGPGISADILPNIFDPFYTTKRPGRGTGLGLSICKAILREHGGNVEAASGPGGGAIFTVMLPSAAIPSTIRGA